jgi:hypothetical protein
MGNFWFFKFEYPMEKSQGEGAIVFFSWPNQIELTINACPLA